MKSSLDDLGQRRLARIGTTDRRATLAQIAAQFNAGARSSISAPASCSVGFQNQQPNQVPLLTPQHKALRIAWAWKHGRWMTGNVQPGRTNSGPKCFGLMGVSACGEISTMKWIHTQHAKKGQSRGPYLYYGVGCFQLTRLRPPDCQSLRISHCGSFVLVHDLPAPRQARHLSAEQCDNAHAPRFWLEKHSSEFDIMTCTLVSRIYT